MIDSRFHIDFNTFQAQIYMKRGDTVVKIRISYETPEELAEVLKRLQPIERVRQQGKGQYKKAYVDMELMNTVHTHTQCG